MRIKTIRTLLIGLVFTLIDIPLNPSLFIIDDLLYDLVGLGIIIYSSVFLFNHTKLFARPIIAASAMIFLEVVRIFDLVSVEMTANFLLMLYLCLKALLVILITLAIARVCTKLEYPNYSTLSEKLGYIYAIVFPLRIAMMFEGADGIRGFLLLSEAVIVLPVLGMLLYVYTQLHVPILQLGPGQDSNEIDQEVNITTVDDPDSHVVQEDDLSAGIKEDAAQGETLAPSDPERE
ncbi:MAG: hypothetical protein FWH04_05915 [Oscillospiraceae bacterium]|nr:hypothetical protein [Oscillospiraceae bacterium]